MIGESAPLPPFGKLGGLRCPRFRQEWIRSQGLFRPLERGVLETTGSVPEVRLILTCHCWPFWNRSHKLLPIFSKHSRNSVLPGKRIFHRPEPCDSRKLAMDGSCF